MAHWTPPNRGVTSDLKSIPTGGSFPTMGDEACRPNIGSTEGGTLVSRSPMSKGQPDWGTKGNRTVTRASSSGQLGGVKVARVYTNEPIAGATGRNVRLLPSAKGFPGEFRAAADRDGG